MNHLQSNIPPYKKSRWALGTSRSVVMAIVLGAGCLVLCLSTLVANTPPRGVAAAPGQGTPTVAMLLPYVTKPEPTPVATPVPAVRILQNHFDFVGQLFGDLHIVGEVHNGLAEPVRQVKVAVVVYNSQGVIVDTEFDHIDLETLPAGEKTCFHIWFDGVPTDWAYYEFEEPTYSLGGQALPLAIINDYGLHDNGAYEILGQVRNDHATTVTNVEVVGTLYRADDVVVGCTLHYPNATTLAPGQLSAFKVRTTLRDYSDVVAYRLQADGDPQ
jgi:hypothetical protein